MTAIATTREELAKFRAEIEERVGPRPVAVVMTMGALHAGHAELIRQARQRSAAVIVTDFLNPLQFAPGEDLDKYPRTFDADLALCREEGVDLLFAPTPDVIYPDDEPLVRISAGPVGDVLEGDSRPGHFDGVVTVVAKLLHLTAADLAYFGQKDAQQLWLIARMVRDLDFPVEVVPVPTVRDDDGVALSSRNIYLGDADREVARALNRSLQAGIESASRGVGATLAASHRVLAEQPDLRLDYLSLVEPETFGPVSDSYLGQALLVVAAFVGATRLIDNVHIHFDAPQVEG
ncbi:MAG TPA: pantoate--beta-alanine ligase [Actinomycetes bacterium]|nr:pantoate--beta-alanine ligase [Actinomycetes bacterium]